MHNNTQSDNHHHKRETRRQRAPRLANKRKHFAHLAGSKIASHPVATRIAARAQRHARNSEQDAPSSSDQRNAGVRPAQTVPLRKNSPSSVFAPPLPQRSAQPEIALQKLHSEEPILAQKPRYPTGEAPSWKRLQVARARDQGFLFDPLSQSETDSKTRTISVGRLGFCARISPSACTFWRFLGFRTASNLESSDFREFTSQGKQQNHQQKEARKRQWSRTTPTLISERSFLSARTQAAERYRRCGSTHSRNAQCARVKPGSR